MPLVSRIISAFIPSDADLHTTKGRGLRKSILIEVDRKDRLDDFDILSYDFLLRLTTVFYLHFIPPVFLHRTISPPANKSSPPISVTFCICKSKSQTFRNRRNRITDTEILSFLADFIKYKIRSVYIYIYFTHFQPARIPSSLLAKTSFEVFTKEGYAEGARPLI